MKKEHKATAKADGHSTRRFMRAMQSCQDTIDDERSKGTPVRIWCPPPVAGRPTDAGSEG